MKPDAFRDQVVIVTGASAGIGRALALLLAAHGARLVIAARRADRLDQVGEQCRARGAQVLAVPTDVADEQQCRALVDQAVAAYGRIDMLVNNAGLAASALLEDFPDMQLFRHTMDVNFYGAAYCTYYSLPYLKQARGRILVISSLGGKVSIPYNTPYCSSKQALHGFYDSLRTELRPHGVSCTLVCPWWVATEFHEAQLDRNGQPRGPRGRAYYTRRTMTSEECARISLEAALRRRREVLMGPGWLAVSLKLVAPGLLDWLALKVFLEPAARRAKAASSDVSA